MSGEIFSQFACQTAEKSEQHLYKAAVIVCHTVDNYRHCENADTFIFSQSLSLTHSAFGTVSQCSFEWLWDAALSQSSDTLANQTPNPYQQSADPLFKHTHSLMSCKPREKKISVLSPLLLKKSVHFSELSLQTDQSIPLKLVTPCQISRVQKYIRSLLVVFAKWSISTIAHAYCSLNHYLKHFGPIFQLKYLKIIETR